MEERYLSQIEQSRTSPKPLPLEVIENLQEAIWAGISASVRAVLHQLVDLALADEATEAVDAGRHERTPERRAHRNGSYTRDLATTLGPIEDVEVPRVAHARRQLPGRMGHVRPVRAADLRAGAGLRRAVGEEGLAADRVASEPGLLRGAVAAGDQRGPGPRRGLLPVPGRPEPQGQHGRRDVTQFLPRT